MEQVIISKTVLFCLLSYKNNIIKKNQEEAIKEIEER